MDWKVLQFWHTMIYTSMEFLLKSKYLIVYSLKLLQ